MHHFYMYIRIKCAMNRCWMLALWFFISCSLMFTHFDARNFIRVDYLVKQKFIRQNYAFKALLHIIINGWCFRYWKFSTKSVQIAHSSNHLELKENKELTLKFILNRFCPVKRERVFVLLTGLKQNHGTNLVCVVRRRSILFVFKFYDWLTEQTGIYSWLRTALKTVPCNLLRHM